MSGVISLEVFFRKLYVISEGPDALSKGKSFMIYKISCSDISEVKG